MESFAGRSTLNGSFAAKFQQRSVERVLDQHESLINYANDLRRYRYPRNPFCRGDAQSGEPFPFVPTTRVKHTPQSLSARPGCFQLRRTASRFASFRFLRSFSDRVGSLAAGLLKLSN